MDASKNILLIPRVRNILLIPVWLFLFSCNTLQNASLHGFNSAFYQMEENNTKSPVYVEVSDEKIEIFPVTNQQVVKEPTLSLKWQTNESTINHPLIFRKQGLDIDLTGILMKFRPQVSGIPTQLTADFNLAIYAGWRHDKFKVNLSETPTGKRQTKIGNFGYDFGFFFGPGATQITPGTTQNKIGLEYSGMIIQSGLAAFVETDLASFGLATGFDYLLSRDRPSWIYHKKPWLGLVVGIALN